MANQMTPSQRYELELRALLEAEKFPQDAIPKGFSFWLTDALMHQNCKSIECDWPTFKQLMTESPFGFNLYQMSFAINSVTYCSASQLRMTLEQYAEAGDEMAAMAKVWNELIDPIRVSLNRKISAVSGIKRPIGRA